MGVPTKVFRQTSSDWVALTGEEEPRGTEALRTIVEGKASLGNERDGPFYKLSEDVPGK